MNSGSQDRTEQRDQLERDLWEIARHFQLALDMSDPDHEDFADSGADVVEHLWLRSELVRDTLAKQRAKNAESSQIAE